jgi:hypothetical protein
VTVDDLARQRPAAEGAASPANWVLALGYLGAAKAASYRRPRDAWAMPDATTVCGTAVVASWLGPVLAGAITAVAAVGAVLVSQRAERRRAHDDRLWQQRAAAYADLLAWANEFNAWSLGRRPRGMLTRPSKPDVVGRQLHARLSTNAGPEVAHWLESTETQLENAPEDADMAIAVHTRAEALADAVTQELLHLRVRGRRERRRIGVGGRSLQDLGRGAAPRYRN